MWFSNFLNQGWGFKTTTKHCDPCDKIMKVGITVPTLSSPALGKRNSANHSIVSMVFSLGLSAGVQPPNTMDMEEKKMILASYSSSMEPHFQLLLLSHRNNEERFYNARISAQKSKRAWVSITEPGQCWLTAFCANTQKSCWEKPTHCFCTHGYWVLQKAFWRVSARDATEALFLSHMGWCVQCGLWESELNLPSYMYTFLTSVKGFIL